MARSRFLPDHGLTSRMVVVMFLLGLLYVAAIGALIAFTDIGWVAILVIAGLVFAAQWFFSDKIALTAMRAREVSPDEAPELHGVIDRLCALADMPKPRVAIAQTELPNAFATGRNQKRAVVCVTTGLLERLDERELEGVLAHELSHVAHRDVAVMTIASFLGVIAGLVARYGLYLRFGRDNRAAAVALAIWLGSLVVYAISFLLLRLLSRYRELAADRAGAFLTLKPAALATALQKISGEIAAIPQRDLRANNAMNAFFIAPAVSGASLRTLTATHPSLEQRLEQLARIQAELSRPAG